MVTDIAFRSSGTIGQSSFCGRIPNTPIYNLFIRVFSISLTKARTVFFFIERVIFVNFWRDFESKEHGNSLLRFSYFTFVSMVLARMVLKKSSSTLFSCNSTIRDKMFETPTLFSKGRKFTPLPHKSQVAVLVLPTTGGRLHVREECPVKG